MAEALFEVLRGPRAVQYGLSAGSRGAAGACQRRSSLFGALVSPEVHEDSEKTKFTWSVRSPSTRTSWTAEEGSPARHSRSAGSWEKPRIEALLSRPDTVRGPLCPWRMAARDHPGVAPVKNETRCIVAYTLSRECIDRTNTAEWPRYAAILGQGWRSRAEVTYRMFLVRAVMKVRRQEAGRGRRSRKFGPGPSLHEPLTGLQESDVAEEFCPEGEAGRGDGVPQVRGHRHLATHAIRGNTSSSRQQSGRNVKSIDALWSDTNKGNEAELDIFNRLCAREIKVAQRHRDRRQRFRPLRQQATDRANNPHDLLAAYQQAFCQRRQESEGKAFRHQTDLIPLRLQHESICTWKFLRH